MLYFVYNKEVNMKKIGMIFILFLGIIVSSSLLASCGEETVPVEDISMPENVELFKGQSKVIDVDFTPQNAYNYYINFESSDNQIVEITNSSFNKVRVYAKNYGNATITCIVKNIEGSEEITAETNISVTDGEMFDIAIDSDQLDLLYYEGQTLNLSDIKVYACYQSGNRVLLQENEYEINIPNPLTIGSVVRVQYGVYQDATIGTKGRRPYSNVSGNAGISLFGYGIAKEYTHPYPFDFNETGFRHEINDFQVIPNCPMTTHEFSINIPFMSVSENKIFIGIDKSWHFGFGGHIKVGLEFNR